MQLLPMNFPKAWFLRLSFLLAPIVLALGMTGCATTDYQAAMDTTRDLGSNTVPILNVGDTVTINFSGLPEEVSMPGTVETTIKGDGTIALPNFDRVQAAGKNAGDLENDIRNLYVPAYFTHLNVTVKTASDLVYFVRGEVRSPGRLIYVGSITVTKAITSAGDFTDFADRKRIILTRATGARFRLDCDKILNGEAPDPPVLPGDQIEVKKRWW
jgi:protein involved in polysaccharide export with SLBB domain